LNSPLQVQQFEIREGLGGNLDTIEIMTRVARERAALPFIREAAHQILNDYESESNDYVFEAKAIGDYVKRNVRYVKDAEGIEQLTDPLTLIDKINQGIAREDCDGMSLLIATLLLAIGHQPYFRAVKYSPDIEHYQHIYVVDYICNGSEDQERIVLDAIIKNRGIGFEIKHFDGKEFPV
jgi:hypothetical protein